jgi:hypothetical protein
MATTRYTPAQQNVVDSDNRNMSQAGYPMSGEIDNLWAAIDTGPIGITSNPIDIDSLALGGGAFSYNASSSSGLNFGYNAGRINWGASFVNYSASSIALSASLTNYVEADVNGTIYKNTSAFTAGRCPLYTVVTGSTTIATVTSAKMLLSAIPPGGIDSAQLGGNSVTGAILSVVAATREVTRSIAALSATASFLPIIAPVTGVVSAASLLPDTAVSASDTNYWTFTIVNLGQANAGTQAILAATAPNTTKATGGTAMAVNVPFPLALAGTTLAVTKGDVLVITATKTASATTIANLHAYIDFTFTN